MTLTRICAAGLTALIGFARLSSVLLAADPVAERFWPQWRGPYASGVSRSANPALEWSETKNIRWKTEIPGRGSASPIVWGERLFVVTAIPMGASGATIDAGVRQQLAVQSGVGPVAGIRALVVANPQFLRQGR